MSALERRLDALLQERKAKRRFRQLRDFDTSSSSTLIDFSSNDYLSLTASDTLRLSYLSKLGSSPHILGSTGSRLLSGATSEHLSLERRLADSFDSPSALLFNSGWDANVSFFATVPQKDDYVIYDELVHASVHSGLRASRVPVNRRISFRHNEPQGLQQVLQTIAGDIHRPGAGGTVFLALESLYSMDGDFAPLPDLLDVFDRFITKDRQCVILDEAHSTGVYGDKGRGIAYALGEHNGSSSATGKGKERERGCRIEIRLMTFGKAVGSSGAVLLCSETIRSFLINYARPLIFSTALPHSTLISLRCAWDLLESDDGDQRRTSLYTVVNHFHTLLDPVLRRTPPHILRYPPSHHSSPPFPDLPNRYLSACPAAPIIGLLTSTPHALSDFLLTRGLIVRPVVPPTVPPGEERVRVCLRADMDVNVVQRLVDALEEWVDRQLALSEGRSSDSPDSRLGSEEKKREVMVFKAKL